MASDLQLGTAGSKSQFFSVRTCHFLAILVHDIMGSPVLVPEAFRGLGVLRAFETRRKQPATCPLACQFMQKFVNSMIQMALANGTALTGVFHAPANITENYGRGLQGDVPNLVPIEVSNAGLLDFSDVLATDSEAVQCAWRDLANAQATDTTALHLSSGTILTSQLGDFLAFVLLHLPMWPRGKGHLTGLAFLLIRQFGEWLDKHISKICSFKSLKAIPELRHLVRAGRLDCRATVQLSQEDEANSAQQNIKAHHLVAQQQAKCWHYCSQVAFELQKAKFKSLTISSDGWRGKGEAMELYFAFSPELNIGGYLPFQVPHHTQLMAHVQHNCSSNSIHKTGHSWQCARAGASFRSPVTWVGHFGRVPWTRKPVNLTARVLNDVLWSA